MKWLNFGNKKNRGKWWWRWWQPPTDSGIANYDTLDKLLVRLFVIHSCYCLRNHMPRITDSESDAGLGCFCQYIWCHVTRTLMIFTGETNWPWSRIEWGRISGLLFTIDNWSSLITNTVLEKQNDDVFCSEHKDWEEFCGWQPEVWMKQVRVNRARERGRERERQWLSSGAQCMAARRRRVPPSNRLCLCFGLPTTATQTHTLLRI